jgi:hypothetical protein
LRVCQFRHGCEDGADCRSRTDDLRFTRPLLWPSELSRLKWSGWQDSNLRPSAPKADALPSCATSRKSFMARRLRFELRLKASKACVLPLHHRRILEREIGFEPTTLCLEGRRSDQLSYSREKVVEIPGIEPRIVECKSTVIPISPYPHSVIYYSSLILCVKSKSENGKSGGKGGIRTHDGCCPYSLSRGAPSAAWLPFRKWRRV